MNRKYTEFSGVLFISTTLVTLYFAFSDLLTPADETFHTGRGPSDHQWYISLAKDPTACTEFGCTRLLKPLLARALPGDLQSGFLAITVVSFVLSGVLMYYIAREFDFSLSASLLGLLVLFTSNWVVKWNVYNFWTLESTTMFFFLAVIYAILTERDWLFMIVLALGLATKEVVGIAAPVYYLYHMDQYLDRAVFVRWVGLMLPAVLFHFVSALALSAPTVFHLVFETQSSASSPPKPFPGPVAFLTNLTTNVYGLFTIVSLFGIARSRRVISVFLVPFVLSYLQLVVIMNFSQTSAGRLLAINVPAIVLLSLHGLERLCEDLTEFVGYTIRTAHFIPFALGFILFNIVVKNSQYPLVTETQLTLFFLYTILLVCAGVGRSMIEKRTDLSLP